MNKELSVGMYVRTDEGIITKIIDNRDNVIIKTDDYTTHLRSKVIKASHNLIDLIEVGDYVNGLKVMYDGTIIGNGKLNFEKVKYLECGKEQIFNYEIKEVLTHEQYENNTYKVVE